MAKNNKSRALGFIILALFACLFPVTAHYLPVVYYENIPQGMLLDVHNFNPADIVVGDMQQEITFERNVIVSFNSENVWKLELFDEKGRVISSQTNKGYFTEGSQTTKFCWTLPKNLPVGDYYWRVGVQATLPNGVSRHFDLASDKFTVFPQNHTPIDSYCS